MEMLKRGRVIVVCGTGNNGGDGLVAARYLSEKGYAVDVLVIGAIDKIKADPKTNLDRLMSPVYEILDVETFETYKNALSGADLIIDAIFGIGLNTELRTPFYEIVTYINSLDKKVISADIPSGLNATTGMVLGAAIKAAKTVTFAAVKKGLVEGDGPKYSGQVIIKDIGIPVS